LKKNKNTFYGFCNIVLLLLIYKKATQRGKKMKNTAQKAMYNKHRYCGFGLNFYESGPEIAARGQKRLSTLVETFGTTSRDNLVSNLRSV
jgi:hypothetical protein